MDYEKKYKEALERAKNYCDGHHTDVNPQKAMEYIFPELKESEDEKIRKLIFKLVNNAANINFEDENISRKEVFDWLEKQGEQNNLLNFNEAEKEKNDFVSGQFIECRKSFNEFKELESYWLEYVGDDTYIGRSDNILNQRFHITPQQLFTLFTHEHCPKEETQDEQKLQDRIIDKACEWLEIHMPFGKVSHETVYDVIQDFKKAMEEKQ